MGRWRRTVKIKDLLTDEEDAEAIKRAANGIIQRLPSAPVGTIKAALEMADKDTVAALDLFNAGLDRVYDWADMERVWLA